MSQNKEYLVRGAILKCSCGSQPRKLNLPKDHGVYTKNGLPMIHEEDCLVGTNISSFGVCQSPNAPAGGEIVQMQAYKCDSSGNMTPTEIVTGPICTPLLTSTTWDEAYEQVVIDDGGHKKTVTIDSFLSCQYVGLITVVTSGQEQEAPPLEKPGKESEAIPPDDLLSQLMNDEIMRGVLLTAGFAAAADGPVPIGDIVGLVILGVGSLYGLYQVSKKTADGIAEAMAQEKEKKKQRRLEPREGDDDIDPNDIDVDNPPKGWTRKPAEGTYPNGTVKVYGPNGKERIRIDPPDNGTTSRHRHHFNKNGKPIDRDGNIVDRRSPKAHIPIE